MQNIILLYTCVYLTTAVKPPEQFFYINEERSHQRILATNPSSDSFINIPIFRPFDQQYFLMEDPTEEIPENEAGSSLQVTGLSNRGRQLVDGICTELRQLQQQPVAVLVQDNAEIIGATEIYMNYIMEQCGLRNDFWLFKFNASGVSGIIAKTSMVDRQLFTKLLTGDHLSQTRQELGIENDSVAVFFSILKVSRELPFGAGILLFVNGKVEDEDLAQLAVGSTMRKQIRIFSVWQGPYPTRYKEEKLILDATVSTHGRFFVGNTEQQGEKAERKHLLFNRKANPVIVHLPSTFGHRQMRVPIEDGVGAIHISLSNNVNMARIYTPTEYVIDLLNISDVRRFSRESYVVKTGETFEIELAIGDDARTHIASATPVVGVWRLETDAFAHHHYNIIVSVRHDLRIETNIVRTDSANNTGESYRRLHLNINGDYTKIDNVTLLTSNGDPISDDRLKINIHGNVNSPDDIETLSSGSNIDIELDGLPEEKLYIQVHGKDKSGNEFQRISYYNPTNIHNIIEPITIRLGTSSELYQATGRLANILYEITNNRDNAILMGFQARDERSYLHRLSHLAAWINPHQTIVVTLATIARGGDDLITFTAFNGADRITKTAIVRSNSISRIYDDESPHMWHTFASNCLEVLWRNCRDYSWTLHVTAQDKETGLLLVQSNPEGLYFSQGYTSGTREEVTGVVSGSCCHSNIVLTAIDAVNNRRSYVADAYWVPLGVGAIVAIVIGVLLALFLIALLIYCCRGKCCRKQKDSLDLPPASIRYRGPLNTQSTTRY